MEADWEVEVGGGAPVIEALWPGFIDLRRSPDRIGEIAEAAAFPALANLLLILNGPGSPLWTAKCDVWEPKPDELASAAMASPAVSAAQAALACYVDLLPLEGQVFRQWQQGEALCREWVARLAAVPLPECRVDLIVRQAIAGKAEGFGVTAYLGAAGLDRSAAAAALAAALAAFAGAIPSAAPPATRASKLQ
jgi:hypothetical protein